MLFEEAEACQRGFKGGGQQAGVPSMNPSTTRVIIKARERAELWMEIEKEDALKRVFDFGLEKAEPYDDWDLVWFFFCGCILEVEDAFNGLLRCCNKEHWDIWMES